MNATDSGAEAAQTAQARWLPRRYQSLAQLFLAVGLAGRLTLYLLNHPLYQDEAYVCLNVVDRDYLGLTRQLDELQVAPLFFLWMQKAVCQGLGTSEQALRLAPFLAGILALMLFWRLARRTVPLSAAALAVGLLAVSRWPLHMTCQAKPYSFDLLFSVVLLSLADLWLRCPERLRWLALLALVTPVAIAASYPAVFVAGGVEVMLLITSWRRGDWRARLLVVALGAALVASFVACDVIVGQRQLGPPGNQLHDFMLDYWAKDFPPQGPAAGARWLVSAHFGTLMGYPYSTGAGSGILTFPLFLVGVWHCRRVRQRRLLGLCLLPFVLTLAAAFLGKYPYGGSRLTQHLAPAICLLAAVGFVRLVRLAARTSALRRRAVWAAGLPLAAFGSGLLAYWSVCPYRDRDDPWAKSVGGAVMTHARPGDRLVLAHFPDPIRARVAWYVRANGGNPVRGDATSVPDMALQAGPVWLLTYTEAPEDDPAPIAPQWLGAAGGPPRKVDTYRLPVPNTDRVSCVDLWAIPAAGNPGLPAHETDDASATSENRLRFR